MQLCLASCFENIYIYILEMQTYISFTSFQQDKNIKGADKRTRSDENTECKQSVGNAYWLCPTKDRKHRKPAHPC